MIGTLLWRRGANEVGTDGDEPQQYGQPTQASGYAAPTRVVPSVYGAPGRHASPTAQFPIPQDPFADADQTLRDPTAYRQSDLH